jgi:hypothetical protein
MASMDDPRPTKFWMTPEFPRRPGAEFLFADFDIESLAGYKIEFQRDEDACGSLEAGQDPPACSERRGPVVRLRILPL